MNAWNYKHNGDNESLHFGYLKLSTQIIQLNTIEHNWLNWWFEHAQ